MQTIGLVTMLLSLLLIYNTVNAIITQQTAQIGELKAIGASSAQILLLYLAVVATYGLCALLLAAAGRASREWAAHRPGGAPGHEPWPVPGRTVAGARPGCHLPAAAHPRRPAADSTVPRITVREAINSYGLDGDGSALDEFVGRLGWLSRVLSLAISSAFRSWRRLLLTQAALAGAGVALVAVMSTQATLGCASGGLFTDLYRFPSSLT